MRTLRLAITFASTATLFGLSLPSAWGQSGPDAPAALIPGSCKRLDFNLAGQELPDQIDLVARVSEAGAALSAESVVPIVNQEFRKAVLASALSCKFMPALAAGIPTVGMSRFIYLIRQSEGQKPGASPAIANVKECAPKPEDYPLEARRKEQTGTTQVRFTTDPKGRLTAFGVSKSSGHLLLDFTALVKLAGCTFTPGRSADGTPIGGSFTVEYVWTLQ
jgi:TonB family protein